METVTPQPYPFMETVTPQPYPFMETVTPQPYPFMETVRFEVESSRGKLEAVRISLADIEAILEIIEES